MARNTGGRARVAVITAAALLASLVSGAAEATVSEGPDWPCIQRKVPRISAGMLWAEPSIEALEGDWRGDAEVGALAREIMAHLD